MDAIRAIHALVNTGHTEIVNADLSGYFDSIPHAELMKSVARHGSLFFVGYANLEVATWFDVDLERAVCQEHRLLGILTDAGHECTRLLQRKAALVDPQGRALRSIKTQLESVG